MNEVRNSAAEFRLTGARFRSWPPAARIAVVYGTFAALWIFGSDHALGLIIADPERIIQWSVYKGICFVIVTSILLWWLAQRAFADLKRSNDELQAHERELERVSRLYAALSQVNQAIATTPTRDELFARVCHVLVEHGGFSLAWIGMEDPVTHQLVPVAVEGDGRDYLQKIKVYSDDRPEGRGPSGRAFRENRPVVYNDLAQQPAMRPWADEVKRRDFRASASLPVRQDDRVCGTLNVYAGEAGFFQDKELALLIEAARDISFGLDNLARNEERSRAEKKVRQEHEFSAALLSSVPGVIFMYDRAGRFLRWNRNLEQITGYSAGEIAGMQPLDFISTPDKARVAARIEEVFSQGESSVEAGLVGKDGRVTPSYFTGVSTQFEGRVCLVGVGIDISARRRAEAALRELNEDLELKVAQRTAEMQAAVDRAEAADRLKSVFLATMSHELRTPLNSIIGFTGIVLQGLAGPLNAEQTKQLGMVRNSARHLLELINDVLDISKIEAGQLEVVAGPFDLAETLTRVTALVRPLAARKNLAIHTDVAADLGAMHSDRRRVEQVLLNLLNNAIKFTEQGQVTLRVDSIADFRVTPEAAPVAAVRLRVSDTGIGIKAADLPKLFQPFRQVDTGLSRQHEGTGLGLAICRRLSTLLGGHITAASTYGQGSEFTVILPRNYSTAP